MLYSVTQRHPLILDLRPSHLLMTLRASQLLITLRASHLLITLRASHLLITLRASQLLMILILIEKRKSESHQLQIGSKEKENSHYKSTCNNNKLSGTANAQ